MKTTLLSVLLAAFFLSACSDKNPAADEIAGQSIPASGGTFEFENGVSLTVPSGALSQDTYITIRLNTEEQTRDFIKSTGLTDKNLLAAVIAEPESLQFNLPVTLKMPCQNQLSGIGVPFHFVFDEEKGYVRAEPTELVYLPQENRVEVKMTSFSGHAVAEVEAALSALPDCRADSIEVMETTRGIVGQNGDCKVTRIEGYVIFKGCPGQPRETWIFEEADEGCDPKIVIEGPEKVSKNSQAELTVRVLLVDQPMPNQLVNVEITGTGSLNNPSGMTNSSGEFPVIFYATEQTGEAYITATSEVLFFTDFISVNDQIVSRKPRTKLAVDTHVLEVQNKESWSGTLVLEMTHNISEERYCDNSGSGNRHTDLYCKATIDFNFVLDGTGIDGKGNGVISDLQVATLTKDMEDLSVVCGGVEVVTKDFEVNIEGYRPLQPGTLALSDSLRFSFMPEIDFGDIENPDGTIGGTFVCKECWKDVSGGEDCRDKTFYINLFPCNIQNPSYSQALYWIIYGVFYNLFPYREGTYNRHGQYELSWCDPIIYDYSLTIGKN